MPCGVLPQSGELIKLERGHFAIIGLTGMVSEGLCSTSSFLLLPSANWEVNRRGRHTNIWHIILNAGVLAGVREPCSSF